MRQYLPLLVNTCVCTRLHTQCGLDLVEGRVVDNVAAGVLEPALSKTKMIQVRVGRRRWRRRAGEEEGVQYSTIQYTTGLYSTA